MLRRRPVMRMAATTAVVAGTATAVSGGVRRHQDARLSSSRLKLKLHRRRRPPHPHPKPRCRPKTPTSSSRSLASSTSRGSSPMKSLPPPKPSCSPDGLWTPPARAAPFVARPDQPLERRAPGVHLVHRSNCETEAGGHRSNVEVSVEDLAPPSVGSHGQAGPCRAPWRR